MRKYDLVTGGILLLFSFVVFIASAKMLISTLETGRPWYMSAGLFPALISVTLFCLAGRLMLIALKAGAGAEVKKIQFWKDIFCSSTSKAFYSVIGLTIIYILVLQQIHYYPATVAYVFVLSFLASKKWLTSIILALLSAAVLAVLFGSVAQIPLP